jgi:microcompartment protein CcmK/EutM
MFLCKVTGTVVAPRKQEAFRPAKLLVVQRVDAEGAVADGKGMLALDPRYGAGVGDYVLVVREGKAVADLMAGDAVSANVIIVGVVDDWSYEAG